MARRPSMVSPFFQPGLTFTGLRVGLLAGAGEDCAHTLRAFRRLTFDRPMSARGCRPGHSGRG